MLWLDRSLWQEGDDDHGEAERDERSGHGYGDCKDATAKPLCQDPLDIVPLAIDLRTCYFRECGAGLHRDAQGYGFVVDGEVYFSCFLFD